ncbi:MAG: hypothetical protein RIR09_1518 [Pseudomonadota bacterium]
MFATRGIWKYVAAASLALGLVSGSALAAESAHKHGADSTQLSLDNGKKWATDAPLRQGMGAIRAQMQAALHAIHENKLPVARYNALAAKLNTEVGGIVAQCKLEPKADEQLHLVIADVLSGAEAMQGKTKKVTRRSGAVQVLGALEKYATYFDHPNWTPIQE